jgi:hypothetical protein
VYHIDQCGCPSIVCTCKFLAIYFVAFFQYSSISQNLVVRNLLHLIFFLVSDLKKNVQRANFKTNHFRYNWLTFWLFFEQSAGIVFPLSEMLLDSGIPRNFVGGGGCNKFSWGQRGRGSGGCSPLVRGSGGSCNLVQEISFHIVRFS